MLPVERDAHLVRARVVVDGRRAARDVSEGFVKGGGCEGRSPVFAHHARLRLGDEAAHVHRAPIKPGAADVDADAAVDGPRRRMHVREAQLRVEPEVRSQHVILSIECNCKGHAAPIEAEGGKGWRRGAQDRLARGLERGRHILGSEATGVAGAVGEVLPPDANGRTAVERPVSWRDAEHARYAMVLKDEAGGAKVLPIQADLEARPCALDEWAGGYTQVVDPKGGARHGAGLADERQSPMVSGLPPLERHPI